MKGDASQFPSGDGIHVGNSVASEGPVNIQPGQKRCIVSSRILGVWGSVAQ